MTDPRADAGTGASTSAGTNGTASAAAADVAAAASVGAGAGVERQEQTTAPAVPAAPKSTAGTGPHGADDGYRRLHPLTPFLQGWLLVAAVAVSLLRNFLEDLTPGRIALVLAVLLPVAALYGYCSWRFTRYRVEAEELRVETGVLFRRTRHVRLDRMQSVDITQPLAARLTGLAVLRIDLAGTRENDSDDFGSSLRYLSMEHARKLRAELLARAAGVAPDAGEAPERPLATVPPGRLAASIALSPGPWLALAAAAVLSVPALLTGTPAGVAAAAPALLGAWRATFNRFATGYELAVSESPDGLRISGGLLDRTHATVPPGRVQAISLRRPPLWRWPDWVELKINVAGDGPTTVLPVAPRAEAVALVGRLLPGVDADRVPLLPPPGRARLIAPVRWRRMGYGVDATVFVVRGGVLWRHTSLIPHGKVQSIRVTQGPLLRLLRLADLHLDTTGGPVRITARLRDAREACEIAAAQATRSRIGRRFARADRWMTGPAARHPDLGQEAGTGRD